SIVGEAIRIEFEASGSNETLGTLRGELVIGIFRALSTRQTVSVARTSTARVTFPAIVDLLLSAVNGRSGGDLGELAFIRFCERCGGLGAGGVSEGRPG